MKITNQSYNIAKSNGEMYINVYNRRGMKIIIWFQNLSSLQFLPSVNLLKIKKYTFYNYETLLNMRNHLNSEIRRKFRVYSFQEERTYFCNINFKSEYTIYQRCINEYSLVIPKY